MCIVCISEKDRSTHIWRAPEGEISILMRGQSFTFRNTGDFCDRLCVELLYSESVLAGNAVAGVEAVSICCALRLECVLVLVSERLEDSNCVCNCYVIIEVSVADERCLLTLLL